METGLHCMKCDVEIYLTDDDDSDDEITENEQGLQPQLAKQGYISNDGDKYICINCILSNYIKHRTIAMVLGKEFEMIPLFEEMISKKYKSIRSLRHRYN